MVAGVGACDVQTVAIVSISACVDVHVNGSVCTGHVIVDVDILEKLVTTVFVIRHVQTSMVI